MGDGMNFIRLYLRSRARAICIFLGFFLVIAMIVLLYGFPFRSMLYPAIVFSFLGLVVLTVDATHQLRKWECLEKVTHSPAELTAAILPPAEDWRDQAYQQLILDLEKTRRDQADKQNRQFEMQQEYYTAWAHQIKTPIASMKLRLQDEDSPNSRAMTAELLRIEQYVEMVLAFERLNAAHTDYVFRSCSLDAIIRQTLKRLAGSFILRGIKLQYSPTELSIITDEKWLSFVLEQILTNALKYTPSGSVSIFMDEYSGLCVKDTGIGIAAEDLPRVFQQGFTGKNGRSDQRASGIGLYLCKRICDNLGHGITITSVPEQGTTVRLDFTQKRSRPE